MGMSFYYCYVIIDYNCFYLLRQDIATKSLPDALFIFKSFKTKYLELPMKIGF